MNDNFECKNHDHNVFSNFRISTICDAKITIIMIFQVIKKQHFYNKRANFNNDFKQMI